MPTESHEDTLRSSSDAITPPDRAGSDLDPADTAAESTRTRIRRLPPEVGAVLLSVGIAGVLLPGPVGTPLLLAGGLVLMPSVFGRVERWMERRFPLVHSHGMRYVDRFIDDFERRYPAESSPAQSSGE
jgi:hypothetical protein